MKIFFGIIDDLIEMRAIFKLLVQLAATLILVLNDFKIRRIFSFYCDPGEKSWDSSQERSDN